MQKPQGTKGHTKHASKEQWPLTNARVHFLAADTSRRILGVGAGQVL